MTRPKKKKGNNKLIKLAVIVVLFACGFAYLKHKSRGMKTKTYLPSSFSLQRTESNYGDKVDSLSKVLLNKSISFSKLDSGVSHNNKSGLIFKT